MSKKLLELANEKLNDQILNDFKNFYAFLKSEDMTFSQSYKCYKFKYKNATVGDLRIHDNTVRCNVSVDYAANCEKYVNGQSEELSGLFMKSLKNKCYNCRNGRTQCSKRSGSSILVGNKCYENICVQAFGDWMDFVFVSVDGSLNKMMRITPKFEPAFDDDGPVSVDTVKGLILLKKSYIAEKI